MVCHLLAPHKVMEGPVLHDGLAWIPHARPAPLRSWGRTTRLWCGVGPAWHAQPTARARRAAAVPGLGLSPARGGDTAHHLGSTTHHQGRETHPQSHKTLQKREPGYSEPPDCAPQGHCGAQSCPCIFVPGVAAAWGQTPHIALLWVTQGHKLLKPPPHAGGPQPPLPGPSCVQPPPQVPSAPRGPCATDHMWGSSRSCLHSDPQP